MDDGKFAFMNFAMGVFVIAVADKLVVVANVNVMATDDCTAAILVLA